jgi:hypothetical protein
LELVFFQCLYFLRLLPLCTYHHHQHLTCCWSVA